MNERAIKKRNERMKEIDSMAWGRKQTKRGKEERRGRRQ